MATNLTPELIRWPVAAPGEAWPVNSIFVSAVETNPGLMLGYGTWVAFGAGKFLAGYSAGDPDFGTGLATGGAKAQPISPHAGTAVDDHASHTHHFIQSLNAGSANLVGVDISGAGVAAEGTTDGPDAPLTHTVTQPDDHDDVSVLPPFIVVYFWRRTA